MTVPLAPLFRPFPFGATTLRNRTVMAPMTRSKSPGGVPTPEVAAYYRRRAEAEVGLILTEGTVIDHPGSNGYPAVPRIFGDDALDGWRQVVDEVHAAGGAIAPQIWHVGSVRQPGMEPDPTVPGYGPSAIPHPGPEDAVAPAAMTDADIAEVIAAYGSAAANARRVGFDGVEIHGAHGYLVDQFLWPRTNRREDLWGGSAENRRRFAIEVVRAVRAAVGPDFPVIFRFSQWKMGDFRARLATTPDELEELLDPLTAAGVDIFHASTRRYWQAEFPGSDLNLAGWTRRITGKPTITVGSVGLDADFIRSFAGRDAAPAPVDELLRRLAADEFDLVAIGRALLADPEWVLKLREGRADEIVPFTPEALATLS
jgi:2,4-dienoyl-CoA reductase-like NADH-dependent reductase (Old Yellow Enzyme family)